MKTHRLLFIALTTLISQPSNAARQLLVQEGDLVEYLPYTPKSVLWFNPTEIISSQKAPLGFGRPSLFPEIATPLNFNRIYLKETFDLKELPKSLVLTMKHNSGPFALYLNEQSLGTVEDDFPETNPQGFRQYDFTHHLSKLRPFKLNHWALYAVTDIVIPILHGEPQTPEDHPLQFDLGNDILHETGKGIFFDIHRAPNQSNARFTIQPHRQHLHRSLGLPQ